MAVAVAEPSRLFGPPLPRRFYARPTVEVARALIGATLVRAEGEATTAARIVETEAYFGRDDRASHGYAGLTARTRVMFGRAGHAYVYFVYGNHDMLNVVTEREGEPAAVLIRAAEPLVGLHVMAARRGVPGPRGLTDGPGRLCRAMGITRALNEVDLAAEGAPLYIAARRGAPPRIVTTPRVGITHERERLQRYFLEGSAHVSRRSSGP